MQKLTTKKNSININWNKVLFQTSNKLKPATHNYHYEAHEIISSVSGKSKEWLAAYGNETVSCRFIDKIDNIVRKRLSGIPLDYIRGYSWFCGYKIYINSSVLMPRQETELLVYKATEWCGKSRQRPLNILEIGTGSGAIAIALSHELHNMKISHNIRASDIAKSALSVAAKNIRFHKLSKTISLVQSDLLKKIHGKFDLIIANLPYVQSDKISGLPDPRLALDGGSDGFNIIKKLLHAIKNNNILNKNGSIILEIGHNQSSLIRREFKRLFPKYKITITRDLAQYTRIASISYNRT